MVPNPCCHRCKLQTAAKIIAYIDMIWSGIKILMTFFGVIGIFRALGNDKGKAKLEEGTDGFVTVIVVTIIASLLVNITFFILSFILLRGAYLRDISKCRIWLIITLILVVLVVIVFFIFVGVALIGGSGLRIISPGFGIFFHIYGMWIIYAFMEEIKEEGGTNTQAGVVYSSPSSA